MRRLGHHLFPAMIHESLSLLESFVPVSYTFSKIVHRCVNEGYLGEEI